MAPSIARRRPKAATDALSRLPNRQYSSRTRLIKPRPYELHRPGECFCKRTLDLIEQRDQLEERRIVGGLALAHDDRPRAFRFIDDDARELCGSVPVVLHGILFAKQIALGATLQRAM